MDTAPFGTGTIMEAEAERIARERDGIAVAEREIAEGLYVEYDDVRAWADSLGTAQELPTPPVRRR